MELIRKLSYLFGGGEKARASVLFLLILFGAGLEAIGTGLIMPFIAIINEPDVILRYPSLKSVYRSLGIQSPKEFIIWSTAFLLMFYLLKNGYLAMMYYTQFRFAYNKQVALSRRLLETYMESSYTFHLQRNSAELLRNVNHEVQMIFSNVVIPLSILVTEFMVGCAIMVLLALVATVPALVTLLFLGGAGSVFYAIVRRKTKALGRMQQHHHGQMIKWVNQGIGGIKEAKVLGRESFFVEQYFKHSVVFARSARFLMTVNQMPRLFIETLAVGAMLLILVVLTAQGRDMQLLLPTLALFAMASFRLMPSVVRIVYSVSRIAYYSPAVDAVYRDLTIQGTQNRDYRLARDNRLVYPEVTFKESIRLNDVYFQYPGSFEPALKGLSLTIPKGRSVAFVGPTGAGKTTVVDMILGLLKPDKGELLVDNVNIQQNVCGWQRNIGYIPQMIYLSDDSIRCNVAFGVPDSIINDDKIWASLRAAQLDEFVKGLPDQLDTLVGERGVRLSGGQRQRIGIARALYHDPKILVLDEATSALDSETEEAISTAIDELVGEKTIIIIAHRPSTIKRCSIIFEMRNGELLRCRTRD